VVASWALLTTATRSSKKHPEEHHQTNNSNYAQYNIIHTRTSQTLRVLSTVLHLKTQHKEGMRIRVVLCINGGGGQFNTFPSGYRQGEIAGNRWEQNVTPVHRGYRVHRDPDQGCLIKRYCPFKAVAQVNFVWDTRPRAGRATLRNHVSYR
jgi:hypothetical protein